MVFSLRKVSSKKDILKALIQQGFSNDVAQVHNRTIPYFDTDHFSNCACILLLGFVVFKTLLTIRLDTAHMILVQL